MSAAQTPPLLEMRGIGKSFGGTRALDRVDFTVGHGEIVALLGENGAGKSTLIKILAGIHRMDEGSIGFQGREITGSPGLLPIRFIHQDLGLFDWMTISENFGLTLGFLRRIGLIDRAANRARTVAALAALGLDRHPDTRIRDLGRAERALVAIARALAANGEVLVLDEPTASLPASEVARLFDALRQLRARGVGIVYVSHRLDEVFELADRVVVLRDGRLAGAGPVAGLTADRLISMIVGQGFARHRRTDCAAGTAVRLACWSVVIETAAPLDAAFRAGEIVGLAGLVGAGQERLGRALFGRAVVHEGAITLDGAAYAPRDPRHAMARGIGFVAGDRTGESTAARLSIAENAFLNPYAHGMGALDYITPRRVHRRAHALGRRVGLRPNQPWLLLEQLSGGNQQKVVVGRWLDQGAKLLVVEDPTSGVDVGARAEIYRLFAEAAAAGATILVVSSDFEEIAQICDRALVFDRGAVVAELAGEGLTIDRLIAAASAGVFSRRHEGSAHGIAQI
ncbi:sugar ABC transporter ATP-binding protein [Acidiphilium sp. PA]|uniref:sugar ABC transporter ATP-binding protein n=1 Tax=Acidiphilium sp. PA TaxID=2871705 RepID=UPI002243106B|nr:sugar ABC transporter ATP-binding protein [Acidiphilium sp. PA]MCW8307082.1 sugar ABC transporter ATP-binding protein [Acidiphilium sp. PA]